MSRVFVEPEVLDLGVATGRWRVVLHNNDVTPFDEVITILMRATGCGAEEAYIETWEAHTYGRSDVHFAARDECQVVAAMIGTIGVRTEVRPEWEN